MNTELIRLKKISEMTSLSTCMLRKMIKRKELKAVMLGNNYYVRPNDYLEFLFYIECKRKGFTLEQVPKVKEELLKIQEEKDKEKIDKMFKLVFNQTSTTSNKDNTNVEDQSWYKEYLKAIQSIGS